VIYFSYVDLEQRVPANHPLRLVRRIVNEVLAALDEWQEISDAIYAQSKELCFSTSRPAQVKPAARRLRARRWRIEHANTPDPRYGCFSKEARYASARNLPGRRGGAQRRLDNRAAADP
jgi:hypothetical protein